MRIQLTPYLFWLIAALSALPLLGNVNEAFKHNKSRRQAIIGGMVILVGITILSCVSSFQIYRQGFLDTPHPVPIVLAFIAVVVVEGAFIWLVFGFTRAFASLAERSIAFCGMCFLFAVMGVNIVTHFMQVKGLPLSDFQQAWLGWGAVIVFLAVLGMVLFITLADPVIRLIRLELRYTGRQQEIILDAKTEGLENERIKAAMIARAELEAEALAAKILNGGQSVQSPSQEYRPYQPRPLGPPMRRNPGAPGRALPVSGTDPNEQGH